MLKFLKRDIQFWPVHRKWYQVNNGLIFSSTLGSIAPAMRSLNGRGVGYCASLDFSLKRAL